MTALNLPQDAQALPYGPLVVGMPVIANHTEKPCTSLVAVIGAIGDHGRATLHYLSTYPSIKSFDGALMSMTPLSAFGVAIELSDGDVKLFRCVEVPGADCTAVYRDGRPRWWQQSYSDGMWWPYRPSVLAMLDRRFLL
jgi:hypothetical protein